MKDISELLNSQQLAAVEHIDGPSLIIAGAGSGKTRVLTYKIAYLLQRGIMPQNILALTFTNKAAREMKERIADLIGWSYARSLWMGTFHAIFSRILRTEAEKIGFTSNYTIFDSADSRNLIKIIIKEFTLDDKIYKPARVQATISNAKNALISPQMYEQNKELIDYDFRLKMPAIKDIYKEYHNRLKASNTMDFDDLLFYTNRLFRDFPDVLSNYQELFQYILVDEYQDTNFAQYLVIKQLSAAHYRVCVVGDDAQSIYSFRGANIDNILNFQKIYPEAKIFKLEQNYRSTQNIVNAANSLIEQNKEQIRKTVFSENDEGEKIEIISAFSDFEEGMIIANKIWDIRRENKALYSDFAILYRTNAQSRIFEEALRKKSIPYRIYGGLSFYHRKEIKDVVAYFKMAINPSDEEAFRRTVNYPNRKIGAKSVEKITATARLHNISLWQVIQDPLSYNLDVGRGVVDKLAIFSKIIGDFITQVETLSAYDMATHIFKESGLATEAYQDQTPEGMSRQENLQALLGGIHDFCEMRKEEGETNIALKDFLSEVSLLTDQDTDKEADQEKVTMMTVHASKGLEFKYVFVVGMEEDLFPSAMAKNEMRGLEEERRLFYVAMTRAKEICTLTFAKSRFRNGQINACNPSRFLKDISTEYIKVNKGVLSNIPGENHSAIPFNKINFNFSSSEKTSLQKNPPIKPKDNFVPVDKAKTKSDAGNNYQVVVGNIIKHERFGIGEVTAISGDIDSKKATVQFENSGIKQLLLKFARFEIVE